MNWRAITGCLMAALVCLAVEPAQLAELAGSEGAAPGKEEALAIIINTNNPLESLTFEELRKLCLAERKHWATGRKVTLALREPGQPEREAVLTQICQMTESEFNKHFLQGSFTGNVDTAPKELASANVVCRFVFNVPGAIGFVRASEVTGSVKVLRLDKLSPGEPGYKLKLSAR